MCIKIETILFFVLNFCQISNRKSNHDFHIVHNCLHGGAPKENGPGFLWIHSSSSSVPSISSYRHYFSPSLFLSFSNTCSHMSAHTHAHVLSSFTFFSSSFPAPFELHRFSNISRSRHHYGHQSVERLVGL